MFEETAIGYLRKQKMLEISTLCQFCSAPHENLLIAIAGAPGKKESHFIRKICVFIKCYWLFQKHGEILDLSNHGHCVQHPMKTLLVGISRGLGKTESHFVSAKMCVYKMLLGMTNTGNARLSNLYHCVQHP